jgi:hypothetical protein
VEQTPPLDLDRPRSVGELLSTAIELFVRHSGLFLSVTLLVVAPVVILVDGVWGGALRDGSDYAPSTAAAAVSALLTAFAVPSLVTSLHAVIVRDMGRGGSAPSVGRALNAAAPRIPFALGAVILSTIGIGVGFLLLIVPGIWLAVRWYFAGQAAVLDGRSPSEALQRSGELVAGRWWSTFGALLVGGIAFALIGGIGAAIAGLVHEPVAYVALLTVIQAVALSLSALFGTLLFFTLRARQAEATRVGVEPL